MSTHERILAATDLSAAACHAVERAVRLAEHAHGELHIVYAVELDALDVLRDLLGAKLSSTKAALEADARGRLAQLVAQSAGHRGIVVQARVVSGTALAVVANEAAVLDAGLVVLGARGESLLRHVMPGSTAARLLRKTVHRPVLVVKQPPRENYRTVLIGVDFSPAALLAIRTARRWAPDAELVLLHAFELPYEGKLSFAGIEDQVIRQYILAGIETRRKKLRELAAGAGLALDDYTARVIHGDPSQQIIAMEREYDADLIVVGKHGTHVVEEMLLGSVTKHVLAEAQADVLVVADPRPAEDRLP